MKLTNTLVSIMVLVICFGGIGTAMAFNVWKIKPGQVVATSADGNPVVSYRPSDIQGTHTFGEISQMFNIPLSELGTAFELNVVDDLADFKARQLKTVYPNLGKGITVETESVRIFVSLYKNMPYPLSDTAFLPTSAMKILTDKTTLSKEQMAFLDGHNIDVRGKYVPPAGEATKESSKESSPVHTVTGKTTFQELLDWGVARADIEKIIGETLPASTMAVRDFAIQKGLDFTPIKTALQEQVDSRFKSR